MDTLATKILAGVTKYALYLIIFLVPLFFLPYTIEGFELNKYFLFYILTLLALICWLARSVFRKTVEIRRTALDVPLLILWGVFFITALFSQERYLSFFGDFSFLGLSFIGLTVMLIFYFLIVQTFSGIKQVLTALNLFLLAGSLSALYFILRVAGLLSWVKKIPLPDFNLTNSANTQFGLFLAIIMTLSLALLTARKRNLKLDIFFFLVFGLSGAALVMIGFKLIWIVAAIALFLALVFLMTYLEKTRNIWLSVAFGVLVMALLFALLGVPRFLSSPLPVEVSLSSGVSWDLAVSTLTDSARNFLFGSGPGTFIFDFSKYRPADFNNNFAWNIRFRSPWSGALEWLMTTGLFGSLALLLTVLMVLGLAVATFLRHILELRRKKKVAAEEEAPVESFTNSPLIFWGLIAGWLISLIIFFISVFGLVHWLVFWLFLGLMIAAGAHLAKTEMPPLFISLKTSPQYALVTSFGFILIFTAIIVAGVYLGRFFTAEVVYARALAKPLDERLVSLAQAVNLNPNRVLFHLTLADSFIAKAAEVANRVNDVNQVSNLVASAVQATRLAADKAPNNVATWEFLSNMYATARPFAPEANNWVITSLEKAVALEPTNPTFYVTLGNAKLLEKRYSEAKDDFEKAISLKPDLLMAYVRLAILKEAQNDLSGAVAALERGLGYGRQDAGYVFQLGRYYFNRAQKGDYGLAELAYRRAIALNPNYSDALFGLALLYERTNNKGPALELYRRVLQLNPGNKDIKKKIDQLSGG